MKPNKKARCHPQRAFLFGSEKEIARAAGLVFLGPQLGQRRKWTRLIFVQNALFA